MATFNFNDYVRIRDVIMTPYRGQIGRIVEVKRHQRETETLDKYRVSFANGETLVVWSIQLEAVGDRDLKAIA
jgi:hypothetical protein